ncbi:MAG: hypothetical protein HQK53_05625 [Oligoflexia bacterium]|nr:hypothetical protein [Oligoflexia bacterium]
MGRRKGPQKVQREIKCFWLTVLLIFSSCSTLPKGEKVLSSMVDEDKSKIVAPKNKDTNYKGRPLFIKAVSYPQLLPDGDIFGGGEMIFMVGREDVAVDELLKD